MLTTMTSAMRATLHRARQCAPDAGAILEAIGRLQHEDGGFRGRGLRSDLYYTMFACQLLDAAGGSCDRDALAEYLRRFKPADLDMVHLCSLARCDALTGALTDTQRSRLADRILAHRSADGGFAPTPDQRHGTIYATLLGVGAAEDLGQPTDVSAFEVSTFQCASGAMRNETDGIATTPATAAAVVLQVARGQATHPASLDWMAAQIMPAGGIRVSPLLDVADLLSTAVALHALGQAGAVIEADQQDATRRFVDAHRAPASGYGEYPGDDVPDAEFTFYAWLAMGELEAMR